MLCYIVSECTCKCFSYACLKFCQSCGWGLSYKVMLYYLPFRWYIRNVCRSGEWDPCVKYQPECDILVQLWWYSRNTSFIIWTVDCWVMNDCLFWQFWQSLNKLYCFAGVLFLWLYSQHSILCRPGHVYIYIWQLVQKLAKQNSQKFLTISFTFGLMNYIKYDNHPRKHRWKIAVVQNASVGIMEKLRQILNTNGFVYDKVCDINHIDY